MKFIITNDDGIESPGIATLHRALEGLGERIVVAPDNPRSGVGHAITTETPIPVKALRDGWFAVGGMPADCARIGLVRFAPGADWVLSGINQGGNLGADVYISGTVAAAREAVFLGCRAIAISQYDRPGRPVNWEWTLPQAARVLRLLLERPPRPGAFWNVNLPALPPDAPDPPVVFCGLDISPHDAGFVLKGSLEGGSAFLHYEGSYHGRRRAPGRDVDVCFGGRIAVTEIPLEIAP